MQIQRLFLMLDLHGRFRAETAGRSKARLQITMAIDDYMP